MHWLTCPADKLFETYAGPIQAVARTERLTKVQLRIPRFCLYAERELEIYYAPLGYVRRQAKVALVGLTPGWQQMELSYRLAAGLIVDSQTGHNTAHVMSEIKRQMSFAGPMRRNLLKMLDELGFAKELGLASSAAIFEDRANLVHTTSALRYPVFFRERNYTGHSPKMLSRSIQVQMVEQLLGQELSQLPEALIIPMGEGATRATRHLVNIRILDESRCLFGFPHPSGANGHRHQQFAAHRQTLSDKLKLWFRALT